MIIDSLARGAVAHARALLVVGVASVLLAGCAGMGRPAGERVSLGSITSFSASQAGAALPGGWQVWTLARFKKPTDYGLITKDGATVVEARAEVALLDARADPGDLRPPRLDREGVEWRNGVEQQDAVATIDEGVEDGLDGPERPGGDEDLLRRADGELAVGE